MNVIVIINDSLRWDHLVPRPKSFVPNTGNIKL
jgi:hypothetical protein